MTKPPSPLRVIVITSRALASADGERLMLRSSFTDLRAQVEGGSPREVLERFQHALEEAAQERYGGQWLAIPTTEAWGEDQALNPGLALLPLDALRAALTNKIP